MHGGRLHESSFVIPILRFCSNALTKAFSKEQFNIVGSNVEQLMGSKSIAEMLCRPLVGVMGFLFPDRRLRVVLQKKVRPLPEVQSLTPSDNFENVSVPGIQPLPELLIGCFASRLRQSGFFA